MTPLMVRDIMMVLVVQLTGHVLRHDLLDSLAGIQQVADGAVMV